jgi:hypothetical protein
VKSSKSLKSCLAAGVVSVALLSTSCSESSHDHDHGEHDVVTTITMVLVAEGSTDTLRYTWDDPDGAGGQPPSIDTIMLAANTVYSAEIRILNDTEVPAEDLTSTIVNEGDQHQFFFRTSIADVALVATDQDVNGLPIGQRLRLTTGAAATGTIGMDLSHYDSPAAKDGQTPSDETDISIDFPAVVN